jgi:hypothetical protein
MQTKLLVTQHIINLIPDDIRPPTDQAMRDWWMNRREPGGLRLSIQGYSVFTLLQIENLEWTVPAALIYQGRHMLVLDRKLTCPYFIFLGKHPRLVLFGSKENMLLALYGDVEKYLHNLNLQ